MGVTLPASGVGTATPIVNTDTVTADGSNVQNVQVVDVAGGVMTRTAMGTALGADPVGTNAGAQAGSTTVGVGIRGWLSTLAGIFQTVGGKVQGVDTYTAAATGNPFTASGLDGSNRVQPLNVDGFSNNDGNPAHPTEQRVQAELVVLGTGLSWSRARAPGVFKTAQATAAGNTPVWTPASGKKFRLLKYQIELTENVSLAAGAVITISFQDATTAMPIAHDVYVPTTALTTTPGDAYSSGWIDLGALGILSAAINQALNANLSAALATGNARIHVAGTEE